MLKACKPVIMAIAIVLCCAPLAMAEQSLSWELINPSGEIERNAAPPAARLDSLNGKNIVLRWNGKHNGDVFLNHLADLLAKEVPTATVVKAYEIDPSINKAAGTAAESARITQVMTGLKPDIVIASQAD